MTDSGGNSGGREAGYLNRSLGIDLYFDFLHVEIFFAIPLGKERELLITATPERQCARTSGNVPPQHAEVEMISDLSPDALLRVLR